MSSIITEDLYPLINKIEAEDLVYNISDESGEIFITAFDLVEAIDNQEDDDYISFEVDILFSGDPVNTGLIDFTSLDEFENFLHEFE